MINNALSTNMKQKKKRRNVEKKQKNMIDKRNINKLIVSFHISYFLLYDQ